MNKNPLYSVLFLVGLAVLCWIGFGFLHSHALGAVITLIIAACYVAGGVELYRYRQATASLTRALSSIDTASADITTWLGSLQESIRNPVRLRIEGERVALPAPALTPYLVGLLVLLGMLGTLLGMMATLRGTGMALQSTADLDAIRGALAAPVQGLGFAFGTSIAGVASSALLGLLSALCRRERMLAVQHLDAEIATTLRTHSQSWQREESFRLLQQQTATLPLLVDRLHAMMSAIEQQGATSNDRLIASHAEFHARTEATYSRLTTSLEQSLKAGIEENARAFGDALKPAVETTLAGLAREASALHETVNQSVQRQLDGITSGMTSTASATAENWSRALDEQKRTNETFSGQLKESLERVNATFEQRTSDLLNQLSGHIEHHNASTTETWRTLLSQQEESHANIAARSEQALLTATAGFEQQAASLIQNVDGSHSRLQQAIAEQEEQRLSNWRDQLALMGQGLRDDWAAAGAQTAQQQQSICDALASSASDITTRAQAHASETIAEISRLVQAASEAPRAAADVIAEMREKLSDSMVRDTAMLEERNQLMSTLQTLLDAVNHASTEQRTAIDALVATSADLLDRVGTRFTDRVETETGKLGDMSAQVAVGATEVASLAEAFGGAVQLFGQTNEALLDRLQSIEQALDRSLVRSDEQLAYYVAQAREVIDLSMLAQQQMVGGLQSRAERVADARAENA